MIHVLNKSKIIILTGFVAEFTFARVKLSCVWIEGLESFALLLLDFILGGIGKFIVA
jgi:hypothetical protein